MDLKRMAAGIPDYDRYLTVDEQYASTRQLVADYSSLVTVQTIGRTRRGDPLELISLGDGQANALVLGGPHPNEPIGCMSIEFLTRHLCQNQELREELGYRWHFIKSLDVASMRLNEGWFGGPFTPLTYYRNFYRPLMQEQPEMLFPIEYKTLTFNRPLPETRALQGAIDTLQPALMLSLHNAELGGVYYYMSRLCPPLLPVFTELPAWFDLSLDWGESDQAGYIERYAPAIYRAVTVKDTYDYLAATGTQDPASKITWGGTSNEYAEANYGTFTLLTEVPYWIEARISDQTPTDISRRQVFLAMVDQQEAFFTWLSAHFEGVKGDLRLDTPFFRAVSDRVTFYLGRLPSQRPWAEEAPELEMPATTAERFKVRYWKEHENQRLRGMFVRMIEAEQEAGNRSAALESARARVAASLQEVGLALERELSYRRIPIRSAVGMQVCAGLAAAATLRDESIEAC